MRKAATAFLMFVCLPVLLPITLYAEGALTCGDSGSLDFARTCLEVLEF